MLFLLFELTKQLVIYHSICTLEIPRSEFYSN